ncbi:di-trans,poly-cis-decaprenylcistransferase [Candidatus Pacearchaeota archaeon]|nr:di-trans,poly-cis-decaprenylcistransferase [Candidatus Pacearchaeota archaeon]
MVDKNIPLHVGIIPDGNRRWAKSKGLEVVKGYSKVDYNHIENLLLEAKKLGIKYVSLWFFSTENWKRPKNEINFLFDHFVNNIDNILQGSLRNKIKVVHLGRKDRLPKKVIDGLRLLESETSKFKDFTAIICMDYGGRDEILRSINKILKSGQSSISEDDFKSYLDTSGIPDPDLIIRTSGEKRLSGFMPFQSVYSEFYFADMHFPDFNVNELRNAIEDYSKRKRRLGGN